MYLIIINPIFVFTVIFGDLQGVHKRRTQSKVLLHSQNMHFGGQNKVLADQKY